MNSYINDFNDTMKFYYQELKQFQPLSKEEELELIKKAKNNNDINARNKVLTSNLKFVFNIAKKYKGCGVPMGDLIAEGNVGLAKAFDKFDANFDVKFISYAVWWIRQSMQECVKKHIKQASIECYNEEELIKPVETKWRMVDNEDEYITKIDVIQSDEEDEERLQQRKKQNKLISHLMDTLDEREKYIITSYFGLESKAKTLEEIGNELSLSKERIRQIREKSLRKLRTEALISAS